MLLSGYRFRLDIAIDLEVDHESMNKFARHEKVNCKRYRCIHTISIRMARQFPLAHEYPPPGLLPQPRDASETSACGYV